MPSTAPPLCVDDRDINIEKIPLCLPDSKRIMPKHWLDSKTAKKHFVY